MDDTAIEILETSLDEMLNRGECIVCFSDGREETVKLTFDFVTANYERIVFPQINEKQQEVYKKCLYRRLKLTDNEDYRLAVARNALTHEDCGVRECKDGIVKLSGLSESHNGVCRVNSQVDIVEISVASAISNGVAVLDLSSCEKLSKVSLSGDFSEKFSVIFPSRHAKSLDISLGLSGGELNRVNFAEFTNGSEFGLLFLEYIQLTGDFPKKIKCSSRVRLTNVIGLPSSLSVEGCAADSWFCDLFDVTKISVNCPYTIPFFGGLNSLTELSIEATDTFSPYWFSSKFSKLRNLKVVKIKCRDFLGVHTMATAMRF